MVIELYRVLQEWQLQLVSFISDPLTTDEISLSQGFKLNDIIIKLLNDYKSLQNGTKRRYEKQIILKEKNKNKEKNNENENEKDKENDNAGSLYFFFVFFLFICFVFESIWLKIKKNCSKC